MSESYCGKNCGACADRAAMHCPGCRLGPGKVITGNGICPIAKCCNHSTLFACADCEHGDLCTLRAMRTQFPRDMGRVPPEALEKPYSQIRRLLPFLAGLCILTAIRILLVCAAFFAPKHILVSIVLLIPEFAYGIFLLCAGEKTSLLFKAGVSLLLSALLSCLLIMPPVQGLTPILLLSLAIIFCSILTICYEFSAYQIITAPFNRRLSESWTRLLHLYLLVDILFRFVSNLLDLLYDTDISSLLRLLAMILFGTWKLILMIQTRRLLTNLELPPESD